MRNARSTRNLCLAVFLGGAAASAVALLVPKGAVGALHPILVIGGLCCVVFGGVGAAVLEPSVRAQARLERGEGVIARWRLSLEQWSAFRELSPKFDAERGASLRNRLSLRRAPTGPDVAITVTTDAVDIDGDFHPLLKGIRPFRDVVLLPGPPACLEFALCYPAGMDGTDAYVSLRFPIGTGPEGDALARQVMAHYLAAAAAR